MGTATTERLALTLNNHQSERMAEQAEQYKTEGTKLYKERKFPEAIELCASSLCVLVLHTAVC